MSVDVTLWDLSAHVGFGITLAIETSLMLHPARTVASVSDDIMFAITASVAAELMLAIDASVANNFIPRTDAPLDVDRERIDASVAVVLTLVIETSFRVASE